MSAGSYGQPIRRLRLELGITQEQLGHALGITVSTVNRWENGWASPSKLALLALERFAGERGVLFHRMPEAKGA